MFERWVKTYEKILDWEWGDDPYIFTFFVKLTLLVNANTKRWHGRTIKRGQLLTSMRHLEERLGWSHHTIQRVLDALQSTGEITVESNKEGTLITIVNYAKYQGEGVANTATQPATQPATNIRNIEGEEVKNLRKKERESVSNAPARMGAEYFGTFHNVELLPQERRTLVEQYGEALVAETIDALSCKLMDGNAQSNYHYATLQTWLKHSHKQQVEDASRVAQFVPVIYD